MNSRLPSSPLLSNVSFSRSVCMIGSIFSVQESLLIVSLSSAIMKYNTGWWIIMDSTEDGNKEDSLLEVLAIKFPDRFFSKCHTVIRICDCA